MLINYLKTVRDYTWKSDLTSLNGFQRYVVQVLKIGFCVIRDLMDGMLTLQAMSLVYTTLLSLVPLVAVSFSVLKGFGVHNQVEPMLLSLLAPLGEKGQEITIKIIEFVENTKAGVLGSLGLVLLFYTVVSLIQKIERSFNFTWRITKARPFKQRFSDYLSVVLLGPLLIFSAIGVTASVMGSAVVKDLMTYEGIGWLITMFARLLPYILVIAAFTVIYIFVPNTRVKVKAAFAGACVAGVLWETVGWAFASFIVSSTKYTAIYSAFATLIFFMIWLYLCWMILLIGASIAFYVQNPEFQTPGEQTQESGSIRMNEKLALLIMSAISRAYYTDERPLDEKTLAESLDITPALLNPVTELLIASQVLLRIEGETAGMVPAHPPETISVLDVLKVVRKSGEVNESSFINLPKDEKVDGCIGRVNDTLEKELAAINLKQLALDDATITRRVLT